MKVNSSITTMWISITRYVLKVLKIISNLQIDIFKDKLGKLDGAYYIKKTSNNFTTILSTVILLFYNITKNTIDHARHFTQKYFCRFIASLKEGGGPW